MRSVRTILAAGVAAFAAAASIAMAAPAGATISPTMTYTNTGVAGYYAAPNANRLGNGDTITGVRSTFFLRAAAESSHVNLGVELCQFQSLTVPNTSAAVLFAQWNPGTNVFDIYAGHTDTTNCLDATQTTAGATLIDTIPAGHTVQLSITVSPSHDITYVDSDQTTLTGGVTTFGGFTCNFDRAGVGANGDQSSLTTPANVNLAHFTKSAARDQGGWANLNRSGLTRDVVNAVTDTTTGTSAGGVLIYPTVIGTGTNDGTFNLFVGQITGI